MTASVRFILTDIEGTTSSIAFVAEELFPYFREHIRELLTMRNHPVVETAFQQTKELALEQDGITISDDEGVVETLFKWSVEDRKITPLKTLQGVLWDTGYRNGSLKGHVYPDVAPKLEEWKQQGIGMGVFSSGSVPAQKLIFGFSVADDLTPYFSAYFDTQTGGKRDTQTYAVIAEKLQIPAGQIVFLSDVREELEAAHEAGFQTIQLVRPGTVAGWDRTATDFSEITF